MSDKQREYKLDILKGILIFLVVFGHYKADVYSNIIYLFHMPLFFVVSGYFLHKSITLESLKKKFFVLFLPYSFYILVDQFVFRQQFGYKSVLSMLYGGRAYAGVYWYITCFFIAICLFYYLKNKLDDKNVKLVIFLLSIVAVLESNILNIQTSAPLMCTLLAKLNKPGIPWNADVALMALFYIAIGFYFKNFIREILYKANTKIDIITLFIIIFFAFYLFNNNFFVPKLLDMKQVEYANIFAAYFLPNLFLIVILRMIYFLYDNYFFNKALKIFVIFGQTTIPILYLHVPLNILYHDLNYSRIVYLIIGLFIPLLINVLFYKNKIISKILGLNKIKID